MNDLEKSEKKNNGCQVTVELEKGYSMEFVGLYEKTLALFSLVEDGIVKEPYFTEDHYFYLSLFYIKNDFAILTNVHSIKGISTNNIEFVKRVECSKKNIPENQYDLFK